jgi:quercetin dioxygenase-like cupin family protein
VIKGPGGFELRLVKTGAGTNGEVLEMEATYGGTDTLPPEHFHPQQTEHFEVLEGDVRAIIGGVEQHYATGEKFDVPAGTPHQMGAEAPARFRWEVRPALRTAEFFERLFGDSERVGGSTPDLLEEFSNEIRFT